MSDDLDDLLRTAMKTLDDQVPSGYFEGLPKRTLARLGEDSSMQTSSGTNVGKDSSSGTAVPPQERDEDSGLHDIRSMASSAKLRINSRRTSTSPPIDDDILASSSAGWKAVALPEPARMVSLPEIDQLPSVDEVKSERKSKKELKAERTSAAKIAKEAIAVETAPISASISPAPVSKPALEAKPDVPVTPIIGARFAQQKKASSGSRTGLYAVLGLGLAAAAGVGWYVSTQMNKPAAQVASNDSAAQERVQAQSAPAAGSATTIAAAPTVEPIAPPAEPAKEDTVVATGMATDGAPGGADTSKAEEGASTKQRAKAGGKKKDDKDRGMVFVDKTETKPEVKPAEKKAEGGEGEPSFDALLKEAGVQDKKPVKVALEKKSLSGADIKKGMSSVGGKAQACYAGTQGTAQVKLTVSPDGAVKSVAVTGVFAGTPVGACVEKAVKGASFPAWDGGPQSFGYSYLLAE